MRTPAVGVHSSTKCFKTTRREGTAAPSACSSPCLRPWRLLPLSHRRRATPVARDGMSVFRAGESGARVHRMCVYRDVSSNELPPPETVVLNPQSRERVDLQASCWSVGCACISECSTSMMIFPSRIRDAHGRNGRKLHTPVQPIR